MHGSVRREAYLAAHAEVDLILDTFPIRAAPPPVRRLWMEYRPLTLAGTRCLQGKGPACLLQRGCLNGGRKRSGLCEQVHRLGG